MHEFMILVLVFGGYIGGAAASSAIFPAIGKHREGFGGFTGDEGLDLLAILLWPVALPLTLLVLLSYRLGKVIARAF